MITHNSITASYLEHMDRHGVAGNALIELAHTQFDLASTIYVGKCLSRPSFLDRAGLSQMSADVEVLYGALTGLTERLFDGDLSAFARAIRMSPSQVTAVLRTSGQPPTKLGRADLYYDGEAFRVMEVNVGSSVGGFDTALLNKAVLTHPAVAEFVEAHKLSYVDTMAAFAKLLRIEAGIPDGATPLVAVVDTVEQMAILEPMLRYSAKLLVPYGIEAVPCHIGQLEVRDGGAFVDGRRVDIVYRLFIAPDLREPEGLAQFDPLLRAVERGEVHMFAPVDSHLYSSKAALALVSDEANRHLYTADELASLDRILPWTRIVRPGPVTVDGEQVDLREYAMAQREDLMLKPTAMYGGRGIVPGWRVEPDEWRGQVEKAMDEPYVLQRRLRPTAELFPTADGGKEPLVLTWGYFMMTDGYGGLFMRGGPVGRDIINRDTGAICGCAFHEA